MPHQPRAQIRDTVVPMMSIRFHGAVQKRHTPKRTICEQAKMMSSKRR